MFDISWGELTVLTGVGLVLIGRKDLPVASHMLGKQIGRIVGLLQGARIRADRFATDHQLKQLQNEFRSGLRELDAVKAGLAGAMATSRGFGIGNNLGAIVPGVDRRKPVSAGAAAVAGAGMASSILSMKDGSFMPNAPADSMTAGYLAAAQQAESAQHIPPHAGMDRSVIYNLAPRSQSVAAVAEEEWDKRGIGFRSIAEQGKIGSIGANVGGNSAVAAVGGATILSNFLRQSLIYDQYERTVREQDDALRSRVEKVREEKDKS